MLRVIDGNGRVQSIAASGVTQLTGGRSAAMAGARLLDVAGTADVLAASTAGGVRLYSMRTRSWSDPLATPAGERAVEIAAREGTWIARSEANRLVRVGDRPSTLIGGGAQMPRRQPSDVLQAGSEIYLSWPGTIQRYDLRSRQVAASWTLDTAEPPKLAGVIGSEPLSVAGGVVRIGEREINGQEVMSLIRSGSASHVECRAAGARADSRRIRSMRRTLAEIGPLRLTRSGAAIEGALRVADLQGQLSWMPIDLSTGRFPFDVVRSIAVVGNTLYVGTDAGLQVYDGTDFALERARLITLAASASATPPTVERVGESCDAPGTAVACGPRGCARQAALGIRRRAAGCAVVPAARPFAVLVVARRRVRTIRTLRDHAGPGHAPERTAGDPRGRAAPA